MNWHAYVIPFMCVAIAVMIYRTKRDWRRMDRLQKKRDLVSLAWYVSLLVFIYSMRKPHWELCASISGGLEALLVIYWVVIGGATPRKPLPKDV